MSAFVWGGPDNPRITFGALLVGVGAALVEGLRRLTLLIRIRKVG